MLAGQRLGDHEIICIALAGVARKVPPSVSLGLKISVQLAALASPIVQLYEQAIVFFMHIHFCFTRNGDYHKLLIKTSNADKQRMLP